MKDVTVKQLADYVGKEPQLIKLGELEWVGRVIDVNEETGTVTFSGLNDNIQVSAGADNDRVVVAQIGEDEEPATVTPEENS